MLNRSMLEFLERVARNRAPQEAVAVIRDDRIRFLTNTADDPVHNFAVSPRAWAPSPGDVLWHSHPAGPAYPSVLDQVRQEQTAVPWAITALVDDLAETFIFGDQAPIPPMTGREFRTAVTDCYELVRGHYRLRLDTRLPRFHRAANWWEAGQNLIMENLAAAGFREVTDGPVKDDVLAFTIPRKVPVPNHLAVYLGDGEMIHHLQGRLSRTDPVEPWADFGMRVMRYGA